MNNTEKKVAKKLEKKGYETLNIEPNLFLLNKAESEKEKVLFNALSEKIGRITFYEGSADLLVYKYKSLREGWEYEISDLFFVEVKSKNDALRSSQIHWMSRQKVDTYIAVVNDEVNFYKTNFDSVLGDEI